MPDTRVLVYATMLLVVFLALQIAAAVMVYAERKVAALMQQRYGPYLVGPKGLLQPLADIVKLFFKEELKPKAAEFTICKTLTVKFKSSATTSPTTTRPGATRPRPRSSRR